jgi:hypothetical protein
VYYDFGFADYVSAAVECHVCHTRSPEFRNVAEMIEWIDEHQIDCYID